MTSLMCVIKLTEKQAHVIQACFCEKLLYLSESHGSRVTIKNQKIRGNLYKWK